MTPEEFGSEQRATTVLGQPVSLWPSPLTGFWWKGAIRCGVDSVRKGDAIAACACGPAKHAKTTSTRAAAATRAAIPRRSIVAIRLQYRILIVMVEQVDGRAQRRSTCEMSAPTVDPYGVAT